MISSLRSVTILSQLRISVRSIRMTTFPQHSDEKPNSVKAIQNKGDEKLIATYSPEISPKNIKGIISKEMVEQKVKVTDIPPETKFTHPENHKGSKRYIEARGFAWFTCKKIHEPRKKLRRWPSAYAWCFIDLKRQRICYRDGQDCRKHNSRAVGPEFTEEALKGMAKYVVSEFLIRSGKKQRKPRNYVSWYDESEPHDEERCGKCRRLGRRCSTRLNYND